MLNIMHNSEIISGLKSCLIALYNLAKKLSGPVCEWLAEIFRHSATLGWAAYHFDIDSQNIVGMFLHNSVVGHRMPSCPPRGRLARRRRAVTSLA